jgi:ribosomal RNA-processing protein 9
MSRLRKKSSGSGNTSSGATKKQKTIDLGWKNDNDEHIDSDEEEEGYQAPSLDDEDVEEEETLDAKKVRLARQYLRKIEAGDSDESSASESDEEDEVKHDRIGIKLQRERLKQEGTLERAVADKVDKSLNQMRQSFESASVASQTTVEKEAKEWISAGHVKLLRGHDLTPTCVGLQLSGDKAISGSKDHSVILWDVEQERKDITLCQTWKRQGDPDTSRTQGEVLSVACSDDGRYAAVGRRDATVSIFDIRSGKNNLVKTFTGHKGPITCLSFRSQSLQLFSGSDDRCIR